MKKLIALFVIITLTIMSFAQIEDNQLYNTFEDELYNIQKIEEVNFSLVRNVDETVWKLDSMYTYGTDIEGENWYLIYGEFSNYNDNAKIINSKSLFWDLNNDIWFENKDTTYYQYFDSGIMYLEIKKPWNSDTEDWESYSYYLENNTFEKPDIYYTKNWYYTNNVFYSGVKYNYTYNDQNLISERERFDWNIETEEWERDRFYEFHYDENDILQVRYDSIWDSENESYFLRYKVESIYNSDNQLISYTYVNWNEDEQTWTNSLQVVNTYENEIIIEQEYFAWNVEMESWSNYWKINYLYGENDNLLSYIRIKWNSEISDWENKTKHEYGYDENGNRLYYEYLIWDEEGEEWSNFSKEEYFWSNVEVAGNMEINSIGVEFFPNPADAFIHIDNKLSLNNNRIEIYSLEGKLVKRGFLDINNQFSIDVLPEGTYLAKVYSDQGDILLKFVKK